MQKSQSVAVTTDQVRLQLSCELSVYVASGCRSPRKSGPQPRRRRLETEVAKSRSTDYHSSYWRGH